jgi:hypothetical protein
MDYAFHDEAQRLQQVIIPGHCATMACATNIFQYRLSLEEQSKQGKVTKSSAEVSKETASGRIYNEIRDRKTPTANGSSLESESVKDPMIFPGLYAPSGFDIMGILVSGSVDATRASQSLVYYYTPYCTGYQF